MNLTTQTFLQHLPVGQSVFIDALKPLLALQDEVREAFGYSIQNDVESAKRMESMFSNPMQPLTQSLKRTASSLRFPPIIKLFMAAKS